MPESYRDHGYPAGSPMGSLYHEWVPSVLGTQTYVLASCSQPVFTSWQYIFQNSRPLKIASGILILRLRLVLKIAQSVPCSWWLLECCTVTLHPYRQPWTLRTSYNPDPFTVDRHGRYSNWSRLGFNFGHDCQLFNLNHNNLECNTTATTTMGDSDMTTTTSTTATGDSDIDNGNNNKIDHDRDLNHNEGKFPRMDFSTFFFSCFTYLFCFSYAQLPQQHRQRPQQRPQDR